MYINTAQAAIDAAENSYERLIRFARFDERITPKDIVETAMAKDMLISHFESMEYETSFFNGNYDFCVKFKDCDFEILETIENKEAILLAENACEAYECAYRLNQLSFS